MGVREMRALYKFQALRPTPRSSEIHGSDWESLRESIKRYH
jgi:hypothetical protein